LEDTDSQEIDKTIEKELFFNPGRITALCDGVFAIVMTILVFDFKIDRGGEISPLTLRQEILGIMPRIETYLVVFVLLGFFWLTNHRVFVYIKRADSTFIWLNIFFLIFISLLPFSIDLVAEFERYPIVVALFGVNLLFIQLTIFLKWRYATHNHKLVDKNLSRETIINKDINYLSSLAVFFVSIPLAFLHYNIPFILFCLVPITTWLLNRSRIKGKILNN